MKVTILGAGAIGSAMTFPLVDNGHIVNLWGTEYDLKILESLAESRHHPSLGVTLPLGVNSFYPEELGDALSGSEVVFIAVSSDAVGDILRRALPFIKGHLKDISIVVLSKGLYKESRKVFLLSETVDRIISRCEKRVPPIAVVGGPCLAEELAVRAHTVAVYASTDIRFLERCKSNFAMSYYHIRLSHDVVGVELCSALKNVYTIAIGWCDGLAEAMGIKSMNNLRAFIVSQAIKETSLLLKLLGGREETVYGLAGLGDLEATSRKISGRQLMFGRMLGLGMNVEEAMASLKKVGVTTIEGYSTAEKVYDMLLQNKDTSSFLDVSFPLLTGIYKVLYEGRAVEEEVQRILDRGDPI
jgi:glycerol-3-phosphate dehydrogenase (NAD(P)+)